MQGTCQYVTLKDTSFPFNCCTLIYVSYICRAQEVFLNLPLRLDRRYGYSPDLIWFDGPPENSGEKYLSLRQGKMFWIYFFFFPNKVKRLSSFQVTPN